MYARIKVPAVLRQWLRLQTDVAPGHILLVPLTKSCANAPAVRGHGTHSRDTDTVDAGCKQINDDWMQS
jgi:hypothetical protein